MSGSNAGVLALLATASVIVPSAWCSIKTGKLQFCLQHPTQQLQRPRGIGQAVATAAPATFAAADTVLSQLVASTKSTLQTSATLFDMRANG